jgi:PHR domain
MNTASEEFELEINNTDVDEQTKIMPITFEGDMIEVGAGVDFTVQMRAYGPNANFRVRGYYGYNGNSYKSFDNQDKDLFEVTYSSLSSNGTGVDSGQVPSIYYYVVG